MVIKIWLGIQKRHITVVTYIEDLLYLKFPPFPESRGAAGLRTPGCKNSTKNSKRRDSNPGKGSSGF